MEMIQFGKTDLMVSRLCLGSLSFGNPQSGHYSWVLNESNSRPLIKRALQLGINFFDTANSYSFGASEEVLGKALKDFAKREDVVIATKVYSPMIKGDPSSGGLSKKAILREIDASLRRLGTDYVDLYQIHRWDDQVPIEETLETLDLLVRVGKVRYLGASSMFAWQFQKALLLARQNHWADFVSMQPHYNLLYREEEREMLPLCKAERIAVMPWSPLARGRLARPWRKDLTNRSVSDPYGEVLYSASEAADQKIVKRVEELSQEKNCSMSQIALAWLMRQDAVTTPIFGITNLKQLDEVGGVFEVKLDNAEAASISALYVPHEIAGHA